MQPAQEARSAQAYFQKKFVYFIKYIEILGSLWYNSTHNETGGLLYPAGA